VLEVEFYTTDCCHLCEEAMLLCENFLQQGVINMNVIEIADSDKLMELYGIRIPVIKRLDSGNELGWPFDINILTDFLG